MIGQGIATVAVCTCIGCACYITKSADPLWALLALLFIW